MTNKELMIAGEAFDPNDPELVEDRTSAQIWMKQYNDTVLSDKKLRSKLLSERFGRIGENCKVRSPVYIDYGYNIEMGSNVFCNFGVVFLDVGKIQIGDNCLFGPSAKICAVSHDRSKSQIGASAIGKKVIIEDSVWIGANAVLLGGVTVGRGAVIGAGAVVRNDVLPGETVF
ncbi:MAG: sugar O-acetyltransferase [Roseibium sp.]